MPELCIDARMLLSTGIGTYLRTLLPLIEKGPFSLRLIVNRYLIDQLPWLAHFSLEILDAPLYSIAEQLKLPRMIGYTDLFWSPHYNIPLLNIRARRRLVTIHDVNPIARSQDLDLPKKVYAHLFLRQAVARSAHIITISEFSKRELCTYVKASSEKITVIHLGVDKHRFSKEDKGHDTEIKKRYRLPDKYFLFVGNFKRYKNLGGLARAYAYAEEQLRDIPLVVVGHRYGFQEADPDSLELVMQLALHQKILFLDYVIEEDLSALYRLAKATILPSLYEGFGLPAVEAMSAGSPLAVSRVASLPEVCGEAAIYFDPHCPADIAQVLVQLATNEQLQGTLKMKGNLRCHQFCWEKCAEAHLSLMEKVCKKPSKTAL